MQAVQTSSLCEWFIVEGCQSPFSHCCKLKYKQGPKPASQTSLKPSEQRWQGSGIYHSQTDEQYFYVFLNFLKIRKKLCGEFFSFTSHQIQGFPLVSVTIYFLFPSVYYQKRFCCIFVCLTFTEEVGMLNEILKTF